MDAWDFQVAPKIRVFGDLVKLKRTWSILKVDFDGLSKQKKTNDNLSSYTCEYNPTNTVYIP